jgi:hypothetical protein
VHRVPGTPARIPITPRPIQIIVAVLLISFAIWALAAFLPSKRPWTDEEADAVASTSSDSEFDRLEAARLDPGLYVSGNIGAIALIVFGIGLAITGALYRAQTETICRKCNRQVIGWKSPFGLQCPLGDHHAKLNWFVLITTIVFWITVICMVGGIAILVFF